MPDFITDFASLQNLENTALGSHPFVMPVDRELLQGGAAPLPPLPNTSVDQYIPPPVQTTPRLSKLTPVPSTQPSITPDEAQLLAKIIRTGESHGNYAAVNPKSTASGAYQYTDSTWNNYGGYPRAALAPPKIQDQRIMQDLTARLNKYNGDAYKVIASHYLPALANDPAKWGKPFKVHGTIVKPVINYVRYMVKGTPLEKGLDEYITQYNG